MSAEVIELMQRPWVDTHGYQHRRLWLELGQPMELGRSLLFQVERESARRWPWREEVRLVGVLSVFTLGGRKVERYDLAHNNHIDLSRWVELMLVLRAQKYTRAGVVNGAFIEVVSTNPEVRWA